MTGQERADALKVLDSLSVSLAECRMLDSWWYSLSEENRHQFLEFGVRVVSYRRALDSPALRPGP